MHAVHVRGEQEKVESCKIAQVIDSSCGKQLFSLCWIQKRMQTSQKHRLPPFFAHYLLLPIDQRVAKLLKCLLLGKYNPSVELVSKD